MLLPLEILERIVYFANGRDAQSWALTCNALLHSSRINIFSQVQVTANLLSNDIPRLFNLLMHSRHIAPFIRHLSILDLNDTGTIGYPSKYVDQLVEILNHLLHLRSLSIIRSIRYYGCRWDRIPVTIQSALYKRFLSDTLEMVSAQLFDDSLTFLECCPRLKHLHITAPFTESFNRTSISVSKCVLQSLRLSVSNYTSSLPPRDIREIFGKDDSSVLDLSRLQTLAVDGAYFTGFAFERWMGDLVALSTSSLVELYWELTLQHTVSREVFVPLNELPSLQILVIVCQGKPSEVKLNAPCIWLQKLMESRAPRDRIASLTFSLPWYDDPEPLQTLIKLGIRGTRPDRLAAGTLEALKNTAAQQVEVDVMVMFPVEPSHPFDGLKRGAFIW
ncbi:hypothetical protein DL96DRAFT_1590347 [Flagelloscypha sp. PMI_526]|nr:hypothetical protein DL96DRAFT_1590347 [Flagelloscypha sp. PMI_526]